MRPTDLSDPGYFHKVVDCQWACPAHTTVPEYIRMIAAGRYTDAFMLNWYSNVFPGILGRTCDRPCEPACRRGRVEDKPVAICRLKRVAADLKGEFEHLLPKVPKKKNGKRIALIGAGPASLTVARDLLPLGYEIVLFEQDEARRRHDAHPDSRLPPAGGSARRGSRLILDMGVECRFGHARRQPQGAPRRRLRRGVHRHRRPARPGPRIPGRAGSGRPHPYRHRLARERRLRPHRPDRASACWSLAAATPPWTAAGPPCASAARR